MKTLSRLARRLGYYTFQFNWLFGKVFHLFNRHYNVPVPLSAESIKLDVEGLFPTAYSTRFFWRLYEAEDFRLASKYVQQSDCVLELGACIGGLSCFTNVLLDRSSRHVVVEANPYLIARLQENRSLNSCNFAIENCVVGEAAGTAPFYCYKYPVSGSLLDKVSVMPQKRNLLAREQQVVDVNVVPLQVLIERHGLPFNVLQMDIEGGELEFIRKNTRFLSSIDLLLFELHGTYFQPEECSELTSLLSQAGLCRFDSDMRSEAWCRKERREFYIRLAGSKQTSC